MKKARYLAAGAASLAKPFFLGSLAVGIGLADSGGVASFYLRYLIFPQLIPPFAYSSSISTRSGTRPTSPWWRFPPSVPSFSSRRCSCRPPA
ncbi:MAG: hypothetical protein WC820_05160, partial [Spirochaetales bacterium]